MQIPIFQVDAFTDTPFGGNPAGVVPEADDLTDEEMQKIAAEMKCSETAFVQKPGDPRATFRVRFFTPKEEVDLCGHATIAAFWLLAEKGYIKLRDPITIVSQQTGAGILPVGIYSQNGKIQKVMMVQARPEFPGELTEFASKINPNFSSELDAIKKLAEILGIGMGDFIIPKRPMIKPFIASTGLPDLLVPIKDRKTMDNLNPDMRRLTEFCRKLEVISVHAFTFDTIDPDSTVYCRDFAPAVGIDEESATGTASGALGAFLTAFAHVPIKKEKVSIICEQGYTMGRPSKILVEVDIIEEKSAHDHDVTIHTEAPADPGECPLCSGGLQHEVHHYRLGNIKVGGRAVTVLEGKMRVK